ncbi:MAG: cell division topological specificity factor MinE [Wigglesworthia glossinidia]|nr:cell division topological specificity factor MinE [Wigglesworthia glossinidia]
MVLLKFFISRKKMTAHVAKKRLQILVEEERRNKIQPIHAQLQKDLKKIIGRYFNIDPKILSVRLKYKKKKDIQIFELNVILPTTNGNEII